MSEMDARAIADAVGLTEEDRRRGMALKGWVDVRMPAKGQPLDPALVAALNRWSSRVAK